MKLFLPSWVKDYKCGYLWFFLTFTFALFIPVVLQLIVVIVKGSSQYPLIFVLENELLIFSMVVICSLVIDHFIFENSVLDFQGRILFSLFPIAVIMLCTAAYIMGFFIINDDKQMALLFMMAALDVFIFMATAVYAAFVKQASFNKRKNSLAI